MRLVNDELLQAQKNVVADKSSIVAVIFPAAVIADVGDFLPV